ncbi:hypothetical protein KUCAC02_011809 [Chaenocephalus aceratus]|uniref:Uncharacterized protein n=1 Tax=Chaenocephalus aceratus TaxID=36190 RepID=A0ACB9WYG3_CHAAC|nr:hypothetical protein KUCAC02_011809 [Chaenocephalus aceratus]
MLAQWRAREGGQGRKGSQVPQTSIKMTGPDKKGNQGSDLLTEETCSMFFIRPGHGYNNVCSIFSRSAALLSPKVYPAVTFCHYTNSICQRSASNKP